MSANIDTFIYVGEKPWHGLGVHYDTAPKTSDEIIRLGRLDWEVSTAQMKTDENGIIPSWYTVYREDNHAVLGVVNKSTPIVVQNVDTFRSLDNLIDDSIHFETAASLSGGKTVFGCFKIGDQYKVLDDDIEHYFVVMNDHLKPDGKVTIMNTPIRVVCQNTLTAALQKNNCMVRIPVTKDVGINMNLANKILSSASDSIVRLNEVAEDLVSKKLSPSQMDTIMDELFPFLKADAEGTHAKTNMAVEYARTTFIEQCLNADNLANYAGTQYQVFNALTDYAQHYFKKADKAFDLDSRMSRINGLATDGPATLVTKFLKMSKKLSA